MCVRAVFGAAACAWLGLSVAFGVPAQAQQARSTATSAPDRARDGGVISGRIAAVDYRRNTIVVDRTTIYVMPSTQIQGKDAGFHVFSDLKRGMNVDVYTSTVDGRYNAQIITLH